MNKTISFRRLCTLTVMSSSKVAVVFAVMSFLFNITRAELSIYPSSIYLNQSHKFGRFVVFNDSSGLKIIDIKLNFGYPISDEEGNITFKFFDSQTDPHAIMESWVSMYPRHFELGPQESQVIAFTIKPPENLPNGEYWLKPEVIVQPVVSDQQNRTSELNKCPFTSKEVYRLIVGVNYRQGDIQTGVMINKIDASIRNNRMCIFAHLARLGNAAYRGNIVGIFRNVNGKTIDSVQREIAIYTTITRRLAFDLSQFVDGRYTAEVELHTNQPLRQKDKIIVSLPVKDTILFSIKDGVLLQNRTKSQAMNNNKVPEVKDTSFKQSNRISNNLTTDNPIILPFVDSRVGDRKVTYGDFYRKAKALDKKLMELNREQETILKELRQMNIIFVQ